MDMANRKSISGSASRGLGASLARGLDKGLDLVDAYLESRTPEAKAAVRAARVERQRAAIQARHALAVRRYEKWLHGQERNATFMTGIAGATGGLGLVDLISGGMWIPGEPWMWLGGAALAVVSSFNARANVRTARAPVPPPLPPLPAPVLQPGYRGHAESLRFAATDGKLAELLPTVNALHPQAGIELASVMDSTAPLLRTLVERLRALNGIEIDLPGTEPAHSAGWAAEEVRIRLSAGCDAYDKLLSAAANLLAAPDPSRSALEELAPAVDSLNAYAHGLRTAYEWAG